MKYNNTTKKFLTLIGSILILNILLPPEQTNAQILENEPVYSNDRVTAFKVRSDFNAELDKNTGWSAEINQTKPQTVDTPFRIRFEVESDTTVHRRQYSLQYRWNNSSWTYLEAHDFPYPSSASPTISIVSCEAYFMGETAEDLIHVSTQPANPGAGISLSPVTPGWWPTPRDGASAEWEFALVVRRWADGPKLVKDGDKISLRLVDHLGHPLKGFIPEFTVTIPDAHLGGTFVETPARIGPYENSNGDLYFMMEPTETDNVFMMVKSTDKGKTWFEVDAENRPEKGDLEGVGSVVDNKGVIHIVHQISEAVYHHAFAMSENSDCNDCWVVKDKLITEHEDPPTQAADIVLRPDGSLVTVFCNSDKIQYSILKPSGNWSKPIDLSHDYPFGFTNPSITSLADGTIDIAFKSIDGAGWHRQLLPDNSLTPAQQFASNLGTTEYENISILPLIYLPGKQTTVAIFRQTDKFLYLSARSNNNLWSEPVKISDKPVITNAVDSDQTGADAVAWGDKVVLSYIDKEDRNIYFSVIENFAEIPSARLLIQDIEGSWIRGNILNHQDGSGIYGIIYDAGSKGGSGYNKYFYVEMRREK